MKIAVSIPDDLFAAAEALAARLGVSRSRLYQLALARYLEDRRDDTVTVALDAIYTDAEAAPLDPVLAALQEAGLEHDAW